MDTSKKHDTEHLRPLARIVGLSVLCLVAATLVYKHKNAPAAPAVAPPPACVNDWSQCKDNAELVNRWNRYHWDVTSACKREAEARAKYETKWPWSTFGYFQPGDSVATKGVIVAIDNDVKFQNGFGAWQRVKVACEYDLRAKKVLNVSIADK